MPFQTYLIPSNSFSESDIAEVNDCDEESVLTARNTHAMIMVVKKIKSLAQFADFVLTSLCNELADTTNRVENLTLRTHNIALQLKFDYCDDKGRQTENTDKVGLADEFSIASTTELISETVGGPHEIIAQRHKELSTSTRLEDLSHLLLESNKILIPGNGSSIDLSAMSSPTLMMSSNPYQFDPYYLSTDWMSKRKKILESDSKRALWMAQRKTRRFRFINEGKEFKRRVQLARDSVTTKAINGQLLKIKSMRDSKLAIKEEQESDTHSLVVLHQLPELIEKDMNITNSSQQDDSHSINLYNRQQLNSEDSAAPRSSRVDDCDDSDADDQGDDDDDLYIYSYDDDEDWNLTQSLDYISSSSSCSSSMFRALRESGEQSDMFESYSQKHHHPDNPDIQADNLNPETTTTTAVAAAAEIVCDNAVGVNDVSELLNQSEINTKSCEPPNNITTILPKSNSFTQLKSSKCKSPINAIRHRTLSHTSVLAADSDDEHDDDSKELSVSSDSDQYDDDDYEEEEQEEDDENDQIHLTNAVAASWIHAELIVSEGTDSSDKGDNNASINETTSQEPVDEDKEFENYINTVLTALCDEVIDEYSWETLCDTVAGLQRELKQSPRGDGPVKTLSESRIHSNIMDNPVTVDSAGDSSVDDESEASCELSSMYDISLHDGDGEEDDEEGRHQGTWRHVDDNDGGYTNDDTYEGVDAYVHNDERDDCHDDEQIASHDDNSTGNDDNDIQHHESLNNSCSQPEESYKSVLEQPELEDSHEEDEVMQVSIESLKQDVKWKSLIQNHYPSFIMSAAADQNEYEDQLCQQSQEISSSHFIVPAASTSFDSTEASDTQREKQRHQEQLQEKRTQMLQIRGKLQGLSLSKAVTLNCPGKKVPIRKEPRINAEILRYACSGDQLEVYGSMIGSFYKLSDSSHGYINRSTKGVEWIESKTDKSISSVPSPTALFISEKDSLSLHPSSASSDSKEFIDHHATKPYDGVESNAAKSCVKPMNSNSNDVNKIKPPPLLSAMDDSLSADSKGNSTSKTHVVEQPERKAAKSSVIKPVHNKNSDNNAESSSPLTVRESYQSPTAAADNKGVINQSSRLVEQTETKSAKLLPLKSARNAADTADSMIRSSTQPIVPNSSLLLTVACTDSVSVSVNSVGPSDPTCVSSSPQPLATSHIDHSVALPNHSAECSPVPPLQPSLDTKDLLSHKPHKPASIAISKCVVCHKSVFPAEKTQAINQIWHKECFTCGGNSTDGGCGKVLTLLNYLTHDDRPFCQTCHVNLFGPQGFGFSASMSSKPQSAPSSARMIPRLNTQSILSAESNGVTTTTTSSSSSRVGEEFVNLNSSRPDKPSRDKHIKTPRSQHEAQDSPDTCRVNTSRSDSSAVSSSRHSNMDSRPQKPARHPSMLSPRLSGSEHESTAADTTDNDMKNESGTTGTTASKPAETPPSTTENAETKPTHISNIPHASKPQKPSLAVPKCVCCHKSVFPAEKTQAINQIWHKECFTCGGNSTDGGCGKVLSLDQYLSHIDSPYCTACHAKLFSLHSD